MSNYNYELSKAIRERGIRQGHLATALRWDVSKMSRILNGTRRPSPIDRKSLCIFLGVEENEIFDGTGRSL